MRIFPCAGVAAALLFGVTSLAQGQGQNPPQAHDSTKVALIHQLLTVTRSVDLAISTMEASIPAQRAANPRIPAVFWDRFLAGARTRRGDLEGLLTDVYERHFSSDELRQLIAFYQTPIGQKLTAELPAVTQESMQAGREWGRRLGAEIGAQLESEGAMTGP